MGKPKRADSPISVASTDTGATCWQRFPAPSCSPGKASSSPCPPVSLEVRLTLGEAALIHRHGVVAHLPRDVEYAWSNVVSSVPADEFKRPIARQKARSGSPVGLRTPTSRQNARLRSPASSSANVSLAQWQKARQQQSESNSAASSSRSPLQSVLRSCSTTSVPPPNQTHWPLPSSLQSLSSLYCTRCCPPGHTSLTPMVAAQA